MARWTRLTIVAIIMVAALTAGALASEPADENIRRQLTESSRDGELERIFDRLVRRAEEGDDDDGSSSSSSSSDSGDDSGDSGSSDETSTGVEGDVDGDGDSDIDDIMAKIRQEAEEQVDEEQEDAADEDEGENVDEAASEDEDQDANEDDENGEEAADDAEEEVEEEEEAAPAPAEEEAAEQEAAEDEDQEDQEEVKEENHDNVLKDADEDSGRDTTEAPDAPPSDEDEDDGDGEVGEEYEENEIQGWGDWGPYSECEGVCNEGSQARTRVCYGGDCSGEASEERVCKLKAVCPKVEIPITLKLPCELFTDDVQDEFARGISLVVEVPAEDVTLEVPSCVDEEDEEDEEEPDDDDKRRRRRRRRLHAARRLGEGDELTFKALVSLDASETEELGGIDKKSGAVAKIKELFSDDGTVADKLKTVASQVDSSSWPSQYDPEDVFAAADVDVDNIRDVNGENGSDQDNTMKGILFLTFVVCLTLFVVVVLAIVVWLEYKKCKARDPYTNLEN